MHSAVMQNKKYVQFAEDNTVEVLALSRLEEGIQKEDRRAAKYKTKGPDGQEVEYMVEWPNLTAEDIIALDKSKAGSYNKSGGIPYTSLVDPWTLQEITHWSGGQSGKTIIEGVEDARKTLKKEHGDGYSRRQLRALEKGETSAREELAKGRYDRALQALEKGAGKGDLPEIIQKRIETCRQEIVDAATAALDQIAEMGATDAAKAKRELGRIRSSLRGTGLEDRAQEIFKTLSGDND
jgi:hypothetical protein